MKSPVGSSFGGCGTTGKRTFTLYNSGYAPSVGAYKYNAQIGSTIIGFSVYSSNPSSSVSKTGAISEVSSSLGFPSGSPGLPKVTYSPALQVKNGSGTFINTVDGHVTRSNGGPYGTPCPPYEIDDGGTNSASVYADTTPTARLVQGATLW